MIRSSAPRSARQAGRLLLAVAFVGFAPPASADTEAEIRGASSRYRFADLTHTHASGLVLDALYVGVPDLDQLLLGAGYEFGLGKRASLSPMLYGVTGSETRGMTVGVLIAGEGRKWTVLGFVGHFFRHDGEVADYTYLDGLEVTRSTGRWGIGLSADAYDLEEEFLWLAGPLLKRRDFLGAWGVAALYGDEKELRVIRTLAF